MLNTKELTMPEMQEIVEVGAARFADVEKRLNKAHDQIIDELLATISDGHAAQMTGFLEANRLKNKVRSAAGDVATALQKLFEVHQDCTKIAQEKGVDIPVIAGGGDR